MKALPAWILAIGMMLLPGCFGPARAGDYTVVYAVKKDEKTVSGKLESCDDIKVCAIDLPDLGLWMAFSSRDLQRDRRLTVEIAGSPAAWCCYFSGGDHSKSFDADMRVFRAVIYEGRARHGTEVVNNVAIGVVYLKVLYSHPSQPPEKL